MSNHARIEELSDSSSNSDPSEQDPNELFPISARKPTSPASNPSILNPRSLPQQLDPKFRAPSAADTERHKSYACIYPVYFDVSRTKAEGRRVGTEKAVKNPLAREIVDACQHLGLDTVFEPGKMHPKDWANPGRVRVDIKGNGGGARRIKNSTCASADKIQAQNEIRGMGRGHSNVIWLAKLQRMQNTTSIILSPHIFSPTPQLPILHSDYE